VNKYLCAQLIVKVLFSLLLLRYACVVRADTELTFASGYEKELLTTKQMQLLDDQVAKTLSECRFLYHKDSVGVVTGKAIYECIEGFHSWFWSQGNYKRLKLSNQKVNHFHLLDDYLGNKVMPYVLGIEKHDQAKLLRRIACIDADNLHFIQSLITQGVPVKNVLLNQVGKGGSDAESCKPYHLFLSENITLYQSSKTLYEPIPDINGQQGIAPSYRWEDLYYLADTSYRTYTCYDDIALLVKVAPDLLNKKHNYDGATPLHYYLRGLFKRDKQDIKLVSILMTPTNVNMKSNDGNTPLHELLNGKKPFVTDKQIIQMMIDKGADINIRNNQGVTVREIIEKRLDLFNLVKQRRSITLP
jgi:hypothetical protein